MPKNAYFWKKAVLNRRNVGGSAPKLPLASGSSAPKPPHYYFCLLL